MLLFYDKTVRCNAHLPKHLHKNVGISVLNFGKPQQILETNEFLVI